MIQEAGSNEIKHSSWPKALNWRVEDYDKSNYDSFLHGIILEGKPIGPD
jgi:hypothetical protein